jgi:hypothetical protein
MSPKSVLLYTREDGTKDFVHHLYEDHFLAKALAHEVNSYAMTPLQSIECFKSRLDRQLSCPQLWSDKPDLQINIQKKGQVLMGMIEQISDLDGYVKRLSHSSSYETINLLATAPLCNRLREETTDEIINMFCESLKVSDIQHKERLAHKVETMQDYMVKSHKYGIHLENRHQFQEWMTNWLVDVKTDESCHLIGRYLLDPLNVGEERFICALRDSGLGPAVWYLREYMVRSIDFDPSIRIVQALGMMGSDAALDVIVECVNGPHKFVRNIPDLIGWEDAEYQRFYMQALESLSRYVTKSMLTTEPYQAIMQQLSVKELKFFYHSLEENHPDRPQLAAKLTPRMTCV